MKKPSGTTQAVRAGESGKCCNPPVKKPSPIDNKVPSTKVCSKPVRGVCVASLLNRCSSQAPSTNSTMPMAAVHSERVPLKKPWFTAPEMKLMPEYLSSIAPWCC